MKPTEAQLRQLYELIRVNWRQSGLLYEFAPDPDSVYPDGSFLDEDNLSRGDDSE